MSTSCSSCTFELSDDGTCSHCGTTCWFCCQPRDRHEPDCMGSGMERQIREREDALRTEGRQQERVAVLKELEAVARALSRRDEPGSSIVAALIDWVHSRDQETGELVRASVEAWAARQGLALLPQLKDLVWDTDRQEWRGTLQGPAGELLHITSTSDLRTLFGRRPVPARMEG